MRVGKHRIDGRITSCRPSHNHRHLCDVRNPLFSNQRLWAQQFDCIAGFDCVGDFALSFSIVAPTYGLEHERPAEFVGGRLDVVDRSDLKKRSDWIPCILKRAFFIETMLCNGENMHSGSNRSYLGSSRDRLESDVFKLKRNDIHPFRELTDRVRVAVVAMNSLLCNLTSGALDLIREHNDSIAEFLSCVRKHPTQLPTAKNPKR